MMPYIEKEDETPIEGTLTILFYSYWDQDINQKKHSHSKDDDEYCEEPARKKSTVMIKNIDKFRIALHDVRGDGTGVSSSKTVIDDIRSVFTSFTDIHFISANILTGPPQHRFRCSTLCNCWPVHQ
jgi:hypothetical protein